MPHLHYEEGQVHVYTVCPIDGLLTTKTIAEVNI